MLRFAIPSKGSLYDAALAFLDSSGLKVSRPNPRQYTARIKALPEVEVLLHRSADVVQKVVAGDVDMGITGLDLLSELAGDEPNVVIAIDDLGFGGVDLVLAVPEAWVDVQSWRDLADLAAEWAAEGRQLRIATKYPNLVRGFCYRQGINVFTLVDSQGATEAAPVLGYADLIADITETGTTFRENRLKIVAGTTILRSQACLIVGRRATQQDPAKLATVKAMLELIEARRRARGFAQVIANVPGTDGSDVGRRIVAVPELAGLQGPTVAPVFDKAGKLSDTQVSPRWYSVSLVVQSDRTLAAVDHLRSLGSTGIVVLPLHYVFGDRADSFARLQEQLAQSVG
ncbi:MAG: ATP phosphoribosyltransferase [Chloroflexota bacterium]|nr:ATP phosphoribosyltransferase [Chloroflexota bacterium]